MFPITITVTINSADELLKVQSAVALASSNVAAQTTAPKVEKPAAPKSEKASTKSTPASPTTQPVAANAANDTVGNATPAATETASPTASSAQSEGSIVDFETVKKAFLALSVKEGGRARCEQVLKPFSLGKLSEAKTEQYGQILQAIHKAAA